MTFLTLYNDDCLNALKDIPDKSVDLIICDLPYGCLSNNGQSKNSIKDVEKYIKGRLQSPGCNWDIKIDLQPFWNEIKRIRKSDHSPCIHFCTTKFGYELIQSNPSEFRYDLVWDKQCGVSFLSANKMPMRSHEMLYVFSKAGAYYNRVDITGDFKNWVRDGRNRKSIQSLQYGATNKIFQSGGEGKRCVLSVIQNPKSSTREGHPTEKPTDLYRFLIERYCPVGGTVLDPTFGSGNSVFTAFEMGRNAIGIEKDAEFFKKAKVKFDAIH
jgi:site-specific DNA-methyltransferase (adenine-specific)